MHSMGVNTGIETEFKRYVLFNILAYLFNHYRCVLRIDGEQELPLYSKTTKQ